MNFPDQSHINRVRDALWRRSGTGASVMIGSGFSKNAVPNRPGARELPNWDELTAHLFAELYPQPSEYDKPHPLRTPLEYDAAFGRPALEDALARLVRDQDHNPSDLHRSMLQLPWHAVYTTNWDTLLERTAPQVPTKRYGIVTDAKQIPIADHPRIVKLHGSFPVSPRLIVTEEDYRTYQKDFAPFVNMVQQSMMETIFLLIGFSGDDPNFLSWSGWVRDNLGEFAPKIYLAGWLRLSGHLRRMLEQRNVVPIDLALHPREHLWPDDQKHYYATRWILQTLEAGEPYDVINWPTPLVQPDEPIDPLLQPVTPVRSMTPIAEPHIEDETQQPSVEIVRAVIATWQRNRETYPDWLIIPTSQYLELERSANTWHPVVANALDELKPVEKLNAIRELFWRQETLLRPIDPQLELLAEETLASIDPQMRLVHDKPCPGNWVIISHNWRRVAITLVTAARFRNDRQTFDRWIETLQPYQDQDPEMRNRLAHERCLWAINEMDFDTLDQILRDWDPNDTDPVWKIRKSALMREAFHEDFANQLLDQAINDIAKLQSNDDNLTAPSRESWSKFTTLNYYNSRSVFDRLLQLTPLRCDPLAERRNILETMGQSSPDEEPPPFDVYAIPGSTLHILPPVRPARYYRPLRMGELAGVPPFVNRDGLTTSAWAEVVTKAAEGLAPSDLPAAIRLFLRGHSSNRERSIRSVLSRTRMATLQTEDADDLALATMRAIDKMLSLSHWYDYEPRIRANLEILSRLVVRTSQETTNLVLDKALDLCRHPRMIPSVNWTQLRNLLTRSWASTPATQREFKALDILSSPLLGFDLPGNPLDSRWPDPSEVLANTSTVIDRSPDNEDQWQSCITKAVTALQSDTGARQPAAYRALSLFQTGKLSNDELRLIALALWRDSTLGPDGLPSQTGLREIAYLSLPEPEPGLAQERFFHKWIPAADQVTKENFQQVRTSMVLTGDYGSLNDPQDLDNCLWQLSAAIRNLRIYQTEPILSDEQKQILAGLVETWAAADPQSVDDLQNPFTGNIIAQRTESVAQSIPTLIREFKPSPSFAQNLYRKVQTLHQRGIPAFELIADLAHLIPERAPDLAILIRAGLTADDRRTASTAALGLRRWLESATQADSQSSPPPEDLIREIGYSIASRRNTVTVGALMAAQSIFEHGTDQNKDAIRDFVQDGLNYLLKELAYDRQHDNPEEIPRLRLECARLAASMSVDQPEQHPAVSQWIIAAQDDPLPEVRSAVEADSDELHLND